MTIEAAPGEKPVLYGGRLIQNWVLEDTFYVVKLEGVSEGSWDFRTLVVNDQVRPRSRLPHDGQFTHLTRFSAEWMKSWYGGVHKATYDENTTMKYKKGDIGPWLDVNNAEFTVFGTWDISHVGLKSIDEETQTVRFSVECMYPPGNFGNIHMTATCKLYGTYIVYNTKEGMQEPGQWYLDRTEGKLVYSPLPGENMDTAVVIAPAKNTVISMEKGTADITIKGLTVSCATTPLVKSGWGTSPFHGAIEADSIRACKFINLTVENTDGHGFKVGGTDILIEGCTVRNAGACGILLVDAERAEVTRNHIHHIGQIHPCAVGINERGKENIVSRNEIHDVPYCGIGGGGTGSRYENNHFYNTMDLICDGAAIYIYGKNQVMRGNLVHSQRDEGWAVCAYYMDLGSENNVSEFNVAINTGWTMQNNMSKNCTIRNNLFINQGVMRITYPKPEGLRLEKNIFMADEVLFYPASEDSFPMPNNIIWSWSGVIGYEKVLRGDPRVVTPFQPRDGSIIADPKLVDWEHGDFAFQDDSPARLGIQVIDVKSVGINGLRNEDIAAIVKKNN